MWVVLVPLVALILLCRFAQWPVSLTRDTDFAYLDSLHTYRAVVSDYPSPRRKTQRVAADLVSLEDSLSVSFRAKVYLYIAGDSLGRADQLVPSDTLLIRTRVKRGGMLSGFDYGEYLRMQGIVGTAYVPTYAWRRIGCVRVLWHPRCWQHALSERLRSMGFAPRELGTLQALTLGYKEDIDPDVKRSFQASGAAHVLAVSGLHTGVVYAVFWLLLTGFGRWKPLYTETGKRVALSLVLLVALWGYALLTGLASSVVRSALMLTVVQVGYMCRREAISLNTLAAAAVLILLIRPRDLFSVGFQLSFAAVGAILVLVPLMQPYLPYKIGRKAWLNGGWRYVRDLVLVSVAAWLGTMPITAYYFGQTSNYFLLTNLLVLTLAGPAVVGGFLCLLMGSVPGMGTVVVWLAEQVVWLMNSIVAWIESLPGSVTVIRLSPVMVLLLYGAILTGALTLKRSPWYALGAALCLTLFGYLYTIV